MNHTDPETVQQITELLQDGLDLRKDPTVRTLLNVDQPMFVDGDQIDEVRFATQVSFEVIQKILELGNVPGSAEAKSETETRARSYPSPQIREGVIKLLVPSIVELLCPPRERWNQMRKKNADLIIDGYNLERIISPMLNRNSHPR